jgi:hypothetical protein
MLQENTFPKTSERRRYERYMAMIQSKVDEKSPIEIDVDGIPVSLVDFALGGMYVLSHILFPIGETVNLSINLEKKGRIALLGTVVRTDPDTDNECWGIAIDFSNIYSVKPVRKA